MTRAEATKEARKIAQQEGATMAKKTNAELLAALKDVHAFIESLMEMPPAEAIDFLTNNGEEVEEDIAAAIAKANGGAT
jgi:hypothetical protein